jgi:hypothetical protein
VWSEDIRFVLDRLTRLATDQSQGSAFFQRIDQERVGAFGHSIGGRAAGRACQMEPRIKACLNEDGRAREGPIFAYDLDQFVVLDDGSRLPKQPIMLIEELSVPPSDEDFVRFHSSREHYDRELHERELLATSEFEGFLGGGYWVVVNLPGFKHISFSDLPLIQAAGNSLNEANDLRALQVVRSYALAFFDKYLRQKEEPLLDEESSKDPAVEIKRYGTRKSN